MARLSPREIRMKALQALYQLDARGEGDLDSVRAALSAEGDAPPQDIEKAMTLALDAYRDRRAADDAARRLAPDWPPHRQPAMDRAILRLAHFEISSARVHPAIAINEAVELAKLFGTERSPAFVNGVLDKAFKQALAEREASGTTPEPPAGHEAEAGR